MQGNVHGLTRLSFSSAFCPQPITRNHRSRPSTMDKKFEVAGHSSKAEPSHVVSPKCARCKNHGILCPLKGHKGFCKWKNCTCPNCSLIVERQKIMAAEQTVLKEMAEQSKTRKIELRQSGFRSTSPKCEERIKLREEMAGVQEYMCLHFGSDEARTTMAELAKWSREKDPQPCYINILRRLFPDIKPKVLQLLLAACDGDLIKTVETILPCCKKMKNNGQVTYIKASSPPQKMMLLSRTKFPTRTHNEKRDMRRYAPYAVDRTLGRCPTLPGLFMPPYAHAPVMPNDNCGMCVPGFLPPYYLSRPRITRDCDISPRSSVPHYTTPKYNFSECKTVTSNEKEDPTRTSAAATLISLSNS